MISEWETNNNGRRDHTSRFTIRVLHISHHILGGHPAKDDFSHQRLIHLQPASSVRCDVWCMMNTVADLLPTETTYAPVMVMSFPLLIVRCFRLLAQALSGPGVVTADSFKLFCLISWVFLPAWPCFVCVPRLFAGF